MICLSSVNRLTYERRLETAVDLSPMINGRGDHAVAVDLRANGHVDTAVPLTKNGRVDQ